ncbi:hypothetical protein Tco_1106005 [Tanacetum coccineum]
MASTRASISKVSKRPKINIIPPKQLFVDLTQNDTKTPSPKLPISSPSAPNAPSKTPSTKDTSLSSIDYISKSSTSSTSLSPNGYLNPPTSPPRRVSPPPLTQENASMDITLTLSPITLLDIQFDTPSPSPPIIEHPIPWNLLEAHGKGRQGGDGGACKLLGCLLGDVIEVLEVLGCFKNSNLHGYGVCTQKGYAVLGIGQTRFLVKSWREYAVSFLLDTVYWSEISNLKISLF